MLVLDVPLSRCLRQVLVLGVTFGVGFVLSFRWFALGVGFGHSAFAVFSFYHIVGSR